MSAAIISAFVVFGLVLVYVVIDHTQQTTSILSGGTGNPSFEEIQNLCYVQVKELNDQYGIGPVTQMQVNICAGMVEGAINK